MTVVKKMIFAVYCFTSSIFVTALPFIAAYMLDDIRWIMTGLVLYPVGHIAFEYGYIAFKSLRKEQNDDGE